MANLEASDAAAELKLGLDLTVPIEQQTIAGKTVQSIGAGTLLACLAQQMRGVRSGQPDN